MSIFISFVNISPLAFSIYMYIVIYDYLPNSLQSEDIFSGAVREVKEETGVSTHIISIFSNLICSYVIYA